MRKEYDNSFIKTNTHLGRGALRGFELFRLGAGENRMNLAGTVHRYWHGRDFDETSEYKLAAKLHESGTIRKNHRIVLPIGYQNVGWEGEEQLVEVYYPLIGNGENLLKLFMEARKTGEPSMFRKDKTLKTISEIAIGLTTMHNYGFIHNDLKASNILVDKDGAYVGDLNIIRQHKYTKSDRDQFFHLVQVLLVGQVLNLVFENGGGLANKESYFQGFRTLEGNVAYGHITDPTKFVAKIIANKYSVKVNDLIEEYRNDQDLDLVCFAQSLSTLVKG